MRTFGGLLWSPLVDSGLLLALAGLGLAIFIFALVRGVRGTWLRLGVVALGLLILANPSVLEEERQPLADVGVVIIDDSPSMNDSARRTAAAAAEERLHEQAKNLKTLELRFVRAGGSQDGTHLFDALERALSDIPRERVAGAILVTDGQVHDAPSPDIAAQLGGPVQVLLVGRRNEHDRRLVIEQSPGYGLVGQTVTITARVEEPGAEGRVVGVMMKIDSAPARRLEFHVGALEKINVPLEHAGQTVLQLEAEAAADELTLANNRAAVIVNGLRDRLRVLLVSGEPHAGERIWRNLLKSDAAVDLVHFTILRPPEKQDGTPIKELSLIAFPIRELFELKLDEFHLIIFDRYRRRGVLPNAYFENIARYVANGGALLEASGPAYPVYGTPFSLAQTALGGVLPGKPTGVSVIDGFTPQITDLGRRHPVTAGLPGSNETGPPSWGRWFRQVEVTADRGQTVMEGAGHRPLLMLNRVEKGRVAQLLSDHAWLWAREYEGGGPHAELLRRTAHWLMKEPELEEDDLQGHILGDQLHVVRRSLAVDESPVQVTLPTGETEELPMKETGKGYAAAYLPVTSAGVYRLKDERHDIVVAAGTINPKEFSDLRASEAPLKPVTAATRGSFHWLVDGMPDLRHIETGGLYNGRDWIGLAAHHSYNVSDVKRYPLLPILAALLALLVLVLFAWRREA